MNWRQFKVFRNFQMDSIWSSGPVALTGCEPSLACSKAAPKLDRKAAWRRRISEYAKLGMLYFFAYDISRMVISSLVIFLGK